MHVLWVSWLLATAPAFAKYEPPRSSNTLLFRASCAHELEAWARNSAHLRDVQRWYETYLRDPHPELPKPERLQHTLVDLHDETLDRLVDLPESVRARYVSFLKESRLAEGHVPDLIETEEFLLTLNGAHQQLRALGVPDLGAAPAVGIRLAVLSGVLDYRDVVEEPHDTMMGELLVIETADADAIRVVEETVRKLRARGQTERLREAFVARYRYQPDAAFATLTRLEAFRGQRPRRIAQLVQEARELRFDFEDLGATEDERSHIFGRLVDILREIEMYAILATRMGALGVPVEPSAW